MLSIPTYWMPTYATFSHSLAAFLSHLPLPNHRVLPTITLEALPMDLHISCMVWVTGYTISYFIFWIACHIARLLEYAIITKRYSSLSLSLCLSLSGAFSSFGGSWHGDDYRESGRRGFGLGSNGAMPEDAEASHSEIFIQVWSHQCIYIFFYTCICMFCSQEFLWAWCNLPTCTCAPVYMYSISSCPSIAFALIIWL